MKDRLERVISENSEYVSKEIAREVAKNYGLPDVSLKPHEPYRMRPEIRGATEIKCDVDRCDIGEKYINEEIIQNLDWYEAVRTKIHEHMHEILAKTFPGISMASYIDPTIHEMLAEYLPYKWLKGVNSSLAERWKAESPYYELIELAEKIDEKRSIVDWAKEIDNYFKKSIAVYKNLN
ncbi:MAG: hypothetical protein J7L43_00650 [Candidatus Aenigmarchaeota archaeon]|nr:hypothetical protein [Candidatus Aenigmarchaeota archaeon]